jgi:Zn-finger nucleic acid-binding protein
MLPDPSHRRVAHLHCLYCGGERRGDDSACRKCLAEAPSVPCRRCRAQVFAPRDTCICGERCTAWPLAEPAELACPRCHGRLAWATVEEGVRIEQCARCLGCFVRTQDFSELVEREAAQEDVPVDAFIPPTGSGALPRQDLLAETQCPHCSAAMERARFAQKAALVIDVCPKHGVWMDAGELPRVLDHLKRQAAGDTAPDEADRADQQHWDHVIAERILEERSVDEHVMHAEQLSDAHRTRNIVLGTAVGGPWVGLFMAFRRSPTR